MKRGNGYEKMYRKMDARICMCRMCSSNDFCRLFRSKPLSDCFEEETVKKTAEEIIELVHEGDYEKIIEEYESAKLVTVLTEEDLRNAVQPVMEELGEPGKIERTVVTGNENPETKEEYATAVSIVSYENGKAQYTITFNQTMKMEGFYIK